jgi:DNA replication protein DnaC
LKGHSVLFATAIDIINTLTTAHATGRLKLEMNKFLKPDLLVIDELGYLPLDKTGADLLFQIIAATAMSAAPSSSLPQPHLQTLAGNLQQRQHYHRRRPRSTPPPCRNRDCLEGKSYRMKDQIETP